MSYGSSNRMSVVYVDLSAKVERWEQDSAVAASNDVTRLYLIPGRVKQQVRRLLVRRHGRKTVHFRTFALFIYLAVRDDLHQIQQLVIDQDYTGAAAHEVITTLLLNLLRKDKPDVKASFIRFEQVKGRQADVLARKTFQRTQAPDRTVSFEELRAILEK